MLAIGLRSLHAPPHTAKALTPTNRVETMHDGGGEGPFGQVIRRSPTFPLTVTVRPILHESLVAGVQRTASLVLETLQPKRLFSLHFFQTQLDEHLGFFKFWDDLELEGVHTAFGGFNFSQQALECGFHFRRLDDFFQSTH